ncbi:MAG: dethiobiotin synthase [Planctomycetota bacterium]
MNGRATIPSLLVTGTDTEVGKTLVASCLARLLRERGHDVGVMKPFATGCQSVDGDFVAADGVCLARAAGVEDPHERVCPVRLRHPLAPTVAARLEGRALSLDPVWAALAELCERHECLIVEGIGGLLVPVTPASLLADVAVGLGAPVLIVARAGLGTINHSLLTVECARARGLEVAAVVLNRTAPGPGSPAEETNPTEVAARSGAPVLGPLPYCDGASVEDANLADLPAALAALPGIDAVLEWLEK